MKKYLVLSILVFQLNYAQFKKEKPKSILPSSVKKSIIDSECNCINRTYKIIKGIYLEEFYIDIPCRLEYAFEKKSICQKLIMNFNNVKLDLQKVYLSKIENKELKYLPGFIVGKYRLKNNKISINLEFINEAINSQSSTSHTYLIEYDVSKKKILKVKLFFDKD
jgi:hypothetical protein